MSVIRDTVDGFKPLKALTQCLLICAQHATLYASYGADDSQVVHPQVGTQHSLEHSTMKCPGKR